jgi:small-conductance mechanosensitive channel
LDQYLANWLPAAITILVGLLLAILARILLIRRLEAVFARTTTDIDDIVLGATRRHLPFWIALATVAVAARMASVTDSAAGMVDTVCALALIASMTTVGTRLGSSLLTRTARRSGATAAVTSLATNLLRIVLISMGVLLALSNLGISITPLLTALGVGTLAVALALQPTLSNLFAGLHLTVARPIAIGDFIALENGTKGTVEDIGWRATRIRELANNIIVIPNARVADMVVTNYTLPEPEQAALVQVGVSYASDLAMVEEVTIGVGREVLSEVSGGVQEFEPFIRYHTFGESSINFTVVLRVRNFVDRYLVVHEFIKRLKSRYDQAGIEIPFPQRVLHGALSTTHVPVELAAGPIQSGRTS